MKNSFVIAIALALASIACEGCPPVSTVPDPVPPRPTPVPTDIEWCDRAETRLIELNCPESQPTKKGIRFGAFCRELQSNGIAINPRCLAEVKSCAEVDVCTGTVPTPRVN